MFRDWFTALKNQSRPTRFANRSSRWAYWPQLALTQKGLPIYYYGPHNNNVRVVTHGTYRDAPCALRIDSMSTGENPSFPTLPPFWFESNAAFVMFDLWTS